MRTRALSSCLLFVFVLLLASAWHSRQSAFAFADCEWVALQQTRQLQQDYDRILCWGFELSRQQVGYGYPRVRVEDLEIRGIGFSR